MSEVGSKERITQNRIIKLFQNHLHYDYLGNWKDRKNNRKHELMLLIPQFSSMFLRYKDKRDRPVRKVGDRPPDKFIAVIQSC